MGKGAIPDRWAQYHPIGKRIEGTRFISFKVPLREEASRNVDEWSRLDPDMLMSKIPNLGLIIDLTATKRYYDPQVFIDAGLQYAKLEIPGQRIPKRDFVSKFKVIVMAYLEENRDNDTLIGVHCTHGLNRTGYFICNYMITELNMPLDEALHKFQNARGHNIERMNYVQSLRDTGSKSITWGEPETKKMRLNCPHRVDDADTTWNSYGTKRRTEERCSARRSNRDDQLPPRSSYRTDDTAYRSNWNEGKATQNFEEDYNNLPKSNRQRFWSSGSQSEDFEITNWRLRPAAPPRETVSSDHAPRHRPAKRPLPNWRERSPNSALGSNRHASGKY